MILHTEVSHIYQDIEFLTGMTGLMTHQIPNALRALELWLREKVPDSIFWNGEYMPALDGDFAIEPMTENEREEFKTRLLDLPHPFFKHT